MHYVVVTFCLLTFGCILVHGLNYAPRSVPSTSVQPDIPDSYKNQDWGKLTRNRYNRALNTSNTKPHGPDSLPEDNKDVCNTKECVLSAGALLKGIDTSVDPCEDFYDFVCGSWIDQAIIPEYSSGHSVMSEIGEQNKFQIHKALMVPKNDSTLDEKMARDFYQSCMDETTLELLAYEPLFKLFDDLEVSIPMLSRYIVPPDSVNPQMILEKTLVNFLADSNLFGIDLGRDPFNAEKKTLVLIYQPMLQMDPQYYNPNLPVIQQVLEQYSIYITEVTDQLRKYIADTRMYMLDQHLLASDIANFISMEMKLASILQTDLSIQDELRKMTMKHFKESLKAKANSPINIASVLTSVLKQVSGIHLEDHDEILVPHLSYFKKITALLDSIPPIDLVNYLTFGQLLRLVPKTTGYMRSLKDNFNTVFGQSKVQPPRWSICVDITTTFFGAKVSQLFANHFHGDQTKNSTVKLIEDLRSSFSDMIKEAKWMDKVTRSKALDKLTAIRARDGFAKNLTDEIVSPVYEGLTGIDAQAYLKNTHTLQKWWTAKEFGRMKRPPSYFDDINRLGFDTTFVNAMYVPEQNSIWIPLGIQMPPIYEDKRVQALNYGAIGAVLGHELTHGFDNMGAKYDSQGNYKNWWSHKTSKDFDEKQVCFVHQYKSFSFPILHEIPDYNGPFNVNGLQTLGENIADNGGLREAYRAYQRFLSKIPNSHSSNNEIDGLQAKDQVPKEPSLPGLSSYSGDQLFFMSYAHVWCETKTLGSLVSQLAQDPHPPSQVRVLATLSNMPEFQEAFQCKPSSGMVSKERCKIW